MVLFGLHGHVATNDALFLYRPGCKGQKVKCLYENYWNMVIFSNTFRFSRKQLILTCCAVVEVIISAIVSILLMEPLGEFRLFSCPVRKFSDWYTLFYNPTPNYEKSLHCTQEAVYPLYV